MQQKQLDIGDQTNYLLINQESDYLNQTNLADVKPNFTEEVYIQLKYISY